VFGWLAFAYVCIYDRVKIVCLAVVVVWDKDVRLAQKKRRKRKRRRNKNKKKVVVVVVVVVVMMWWW